MQHKSFTKVYIRSLLSKSLHGHVLYLNTEMLFIQESRKCINLIVGLYLKVSANTTKHTHFESEATHATPVREQGP